MGLSWLYLLLAAVLEAAWTFSLKWMTFSDLKTLRLHNFYSPEVGLPILLPFLGYIFFGIGNIYFFSLAMKQIPMATAFSAWTALTIIIIKISELYFLKQTISWTEIAFMTLIVVGIIGLKNSSD